MNLSLLVDLYELTMACAYFTYKRKTRASFDLFTRELPPNRSYLVFCGLDDILSYIKNLKFTKEDLDYLRKQKLFPDDFLKYLSNFKFQGDIWAMPEGTIFFAKEPVIRVTASIIEAQIMESFLLNTVNLQSMIASKASRIVEAARGREVFDFSLRRTHGQDAGIKVARAAYIAGFSGTSCVLAGKLYNIPVIGTMAHSFVMSFRQEMDSFLAYAETFPTRTTLLVDTYVTRKGIENALAVGQYLKEKGFRLKGIRLDSGDLVNLSKLARSLLDKAGLNYVKIFASGNLDEFKIDALLRRGAKIDNFGVGTHMGVSIDAPALDVIYKISEVTDERGRFLPTMKLSQGKVTYPGRKQVFRLQDRKGRYLKDILGLEKEKIRGRPLLIKVVQNGRLIYKSPSLDKIREDFLNDLSRFPKELRSVYSKYKYPVIISPGLKRLRQALAHQLRTRQ
ncbi:MAG: nicotinate phosphoribosyltransferase [Candidatus Omnitrophica bacterium]|nr:nicotinate phosphoribosyltransferase [Candidatus Omnitrophota bacterium]